MSIHKVITEAELKLNEVKQALAGPRFLPLSVVRDRTGLSKASIYRGMTAGTFPRNVAVGSNTVRWVESEIDAWINGAIAARDGGAS